MSTGRGVATVVAVDVLLGIGGAARRPIAVWGIVAFAGLGVVGQALDQGVALTASFISQVLAFVLQPSLSIQPRVYHGAEDRHLNFYGIWDNLKWPVRAMDLPWSGTDDTERGSGSEVARNGCK